MKTRSITSLQQKTYTFLRRVPAGMVTTYKELAKAVGTRAYRAIGQYMRNNPHAYMSCADREKRVPCHRVVASDGSIGGFMGSTTGSHIHQKIFLLKSEGVTIHANKIKNFERILYTFAD